MPRLSTAAGRLPSALTSLGTPPQCLLHRKADTKISGFGAGRFVGSLSSSLAPTAITGGMSDTLVVNEIYLSLQGESTFAGLPCVFLRLTACDLRCSYCDTAYAFSEGKRMEFDTILTRIRELAAPFGQ